MHWPIADDVLVGRTLTHKPSDICPPKSREVKLLQICNSGFLVNELRILTDDDPSGTTIVDPASKEQSVLSRLQVRFNKFENIGSPDIRTTPAETVTFLRAGTESRVNFDFYGFAGLPDFLTQDAVGR